MGFEALGRTQALKKKNAENVPFFFFCHSTANGILVSQPGNEH